MRACVVPLSIALCWLLPVAHGRAGVYNPGESEEGATYLDFVGGPPGRNFREVVLTLRTIPGPPPQLDNPVRRRYVLMDELIPRSGRGKTAPAALLQESAVLIRRGKFKDAEDVLRPMANARNELDNIPIQSNFATALHLGGELQKAYVVLRDLLKDHWSKRWDELPEARRRSLARIGWSEPLYDRYRECDTFYLKLLRLRKKEWLTHTRPKGMVQLPDALFDDGKDPPAPVRFLGADDDFEAGKIAAAEKAKLPVGALGIVQQLVVWLPDDLRLYWLLGELYNVEGGKRGMTAAHQVFTDLEVFVRLSRDPDISAEVKDRLAERVRVLSAALHAIQREEERVITGKIDADEGVTFPFDLRTIAVSFGLGFLLALFVVWQMREVRRRRLARVGV